MKSHVLISLSKAGGVMLVELMIVMAAAAILATLATPSISEFINSTRRISTIAQITSDLYRARSEAIKRNAWVMVCLRNTNGADCGTGTNWQNGWLLCQDSVPDGDCDAATPDSPSPFAVHQAIHSIFTLTGSAPSIRFNPGGTQGNGGAATLTLASGLQFSVITVAATGQISKP